MKIEDQVCSLELAKILKELGVPQKSIFVWEYFDDNCYGIKFIPYAVVTDQFNKLELYAAFTSGELGRLLPNTVDIKKDEPFNFFRLNISKFISINDEMKHINNFIVNYDCEVVEFSAPFRKLNKNIYDPNLANAMAKMLIHLIENNLMPTPSNEFKESAMKAMNQYSEAIKNLSEK